MKNSPAKIEQWADEPFRVFFPLGVLASIFGVLLWPALSLEWIAYYPLEAHARWMVLGFGGCFITGFLGTAGPRLLGSPPWRHWELFVHFFMALGMMTFLVLFRISAADLMAGLWLLGVLASLLYRFFRERKDIPPPGMPMAALGLLSAGLAGIALSLIPVSNLSLQLFTFLRLLYFQGLIWLPVLAVAPFLLPRFFGKRSSHDFEDSVTLPAGWTRQFAGSLAVGILLIATFACEAWLAPRLGMVLRGTLVMLYLAVSVPGLAGVTRTNGLGLALRCVLLCSAGGWLLAAFFPLLRTGMIHLMFIGGAGLLIITVATRVILGHAGRHDQLTSPLKWFHAVWALIAFAAATRLTVDFIPKVRVSHLNYAAILWVAVLLFWLWKLRRKNDSSQSSKA